MKYQVKKSSQFRVNSSLSIIKIVVRLLPSALTILTLMVFESFDQEVKHLMDFLFYSI